MRKSPLFGCFAYFFGSLFSVMGCLKRKIPIRFIFCSEIIWQTIFLKEMNTGFQFMTCLHFRGNGGIFHALFYKENHENGRIR